MYYPTALPPMAMGDPSSAGHAFHPQLSPRGIAATTTYRPAVTTFTQSPAPGMPPPPPGHRMPAMYPPAAAYLPPGMPVARPPERRSDFDAVGGAKKTDAAEQLFSDGDSEGRSPSSGGKPSLARRRQNSLLRSAVSSQLSLSDENLMGIEHLLPAALVATDSEDETLEPINADLSFSSLQAMKFTGADPRDLWNSFSPHTSPRPRRRSFYAAEQSPIRSPLHAAVQQANATSSSSSPSSPSSSASSSPLDDDDRHAAAVEMAHRSPPPPPSTRSSSPPHRSSPAVAALSTSTSTGSINIGSYHHSGSSRSAATASAGGCAGSKSAGSLNVLAGVTSTSPGSHQHHHHPHPHHHSHHAAASSSTSPGSSSSSSSRKQSSRKKGGKGKDGKKNQRQQDDGHERSPFSLDLPVRSASNDESGRSPRRRVSPRHHTFDFPLSNDTRIPSFESCIGQISRLCKDQHGCRFLQKKLDEKDADKTTIIFNEILDQIVDLMTDPFGNYLCQKLLEHCNEAQSLTIIELVSRHIVEISMNMHGTRAIQKMIEFLNTEAQIKLVVEALAPNVVVLIKDLNGNHVIQRCLNRLSSKDNQFLFDAVAANCVEVATHRHGCCVMQRCLDFASEAQQTQLISQIARHGYTLVRDPYGNYVVQYVLDLKGFDDLKAVLTAGFRTHLAELSCQKFSSNVIEKCLAVCPTSRVWMIDELLDPDTLQLLLRDPFGNYVIQTALSVSKSDQHRKLIDAIRPHLPALRNTAYGKRIQNKILRNGQSS